MRNDVAVAAQVFGSVKLLGEIRQVCIDIPVNHRFAGSPFGDAVAEMPLPRCRCRDAVAEMPLPRCRCRDAVAEMPLPRCRCRDAGPCRAGRLRTSRPSGSQTDFHVRSRIPRRVPSVCRPLRERPNAPTRPANRGRGTRRGSSGSLARAECVSPPDRSRRIRGRDGDRSA